MMIRHAQVAGSFYPGTKQELVFQLNSFFEQTRKISDKKIKALIVPHAGYIYSGLTAAWGYRQISNLKSQISNFVLVGPSHNFYFENLAANDFSYWETPLGKIKHIRFPESDVQDSDNLWQPEIHNEFHLPEHCLEVQLPFLQVLNKDISITCFLTGSKIDEKKLSKYFMENYSQSLFIFSSDLSHYLPQKSALEKDKKTIAAIQKLNTDYFKTEDNVACGGMGITLLLEMAKIDNWQTKLIYYDTSATFSGDTDRVVGYAAIIFY